MDGIVGVDESQQVLISVNSFGLDEGEHSTVLLLTSNDPETHSMSMPVDLVIFLGADDKQLPVRMLFILHTPTLSTKHNNSL